MCASLQPLTQHANMRTHAHAAPPPALQPPNTHTHTHTQGAHPPRTFNSLGLPGEWYGALEWVDTGDNGAGGGGGGGGGPGGGARRHMQRVPTINIMKVRGRVRCWVLGGWLAWVLGVLASHSGCGGA